MYGSAVGECLTLAIGSFRRVVSVADYVGGGCVIGVRKSGGWLPAILLADSLVYGASVSGCLDFLRCTYCCRRFTCRPMSLW